MFNYIKGTIKEINSNNVVVENNDIGYLVNVANPYIYKINDYEKIYLYNHVREDEFLLYGFKDKKELELFLKLLNVKGLGPKTLMPFFATESIFGIIDAINRENIKYLMKFPKVGEKLAKQIILDLKGKINIELDFETKENENELILVLESLGYNKALIKNVIKEINQDESLEKQIKDSLKLLMKV